MSLDDARSSPALLARLAGVLTFEVAAVVSLHWAGRYRFLQVPFGDLDRWLSDAPAEDVLAAAIRLVGLAVAYWVLGSTVLYAASLLAGRSGLLRSMSWVMLPGARRVLDGVLALSITGSSLTASLPAASASSVATPAEPAQRRPPTQPAAPERVASKVALYPQSVALPAPPPDARTHQVRGGESLLEIAADHLGDQASWPDIWQANADRLRAVGLAIDTRPQIGWTLVLPAERPAPPPLAGSDELLAETVTVQPGDNLWDLSETRLADHLQRAPADQEVAPYWHETINTNLDQLASGDPNLVHPGEQIVLPPLGDHPAPTPERPNGDSSPPPTPTTPSPTTDAPVTPTTAAAPSTTTATPTTRTPSTAPTTQPAPKTTQPGATDGEPTSPVSPTSVIAAGVTTALATLTLRALARRRRARHRTARLGTVTPARPAEDLATELALAGVTSRALDRAWDAVQHLRSAFTNSEAPTVTGIVVSPNGDVIIHLLDPAPPVTPFTDSPVGANAWRLPADQTSPPDPDRDGTTPLLETVVAVGRTDDGSWVFLDLESLGAITITGDTDQAARLARSIAAELALQPANHYVDLTVTGDLEPPAGTEHQGVMVVDHLDEPLVRQLQRGADETVAYLTTEGASTTATGRAHGVARDALVVTVVITSHGTDPVLLDRLTDAALPGGRGLAVVALDPLSEPATQLDVDPDGTLHLPHLELTATAAGLDADDLRQLDHLLEREPQTVTPTQSRPVHGEPPLSLPPWDYLVRLFAGHRVETADGTVLSFRYGDPGVPNKNTARGAELLSYLALRSDRSATVAEIRDHLWWGKDISHRSAETLVSGTRRRLGGTKYISHVEGHPGHKRYTLQPTIVTDLDLLEHDLAHAQVLAEDQPDKAAELLRQRLATIEAAAFHEDSAGAGLADWAGANRVIDRVQQPIIDAALLAADLYTSQGPQGRPNARFVIDQALNACPNNEALTRTGMQLDALSGHREAAHSRYIALARNLARDELEPEPETTDVHREIMRPGA
jgi:hypothetical protein